MSNKLIKANPNLPNNINEMLKNLITSPADKTAYSKEGNLIKIQKVTKDGIINIEAKSYPHGNKISQFNISKTTKKKELKSTIDDMILEGYSNKEIAALLDISPSYVSKLKKNS